jgi:hypothetical protein
LMPYPAGCNPGSSGSSSSSSMCGILFVSKGLSCLVSSCSSSSPCYGP